jgi:peroxiredoxin
MAGMLAPVRRIKVFCFFSSEKKALPCYFLFNHMENATMRITMASGLLAGLCLAAPAFGSLLPGAHAPDFSTPATLGGKEFSFSLDQALKKGPVVLYFYPAAFTRGCTEEAHEFADAVPKFAALHATVIGVSMDGIQKLDKFSVLECRSAFPVASDKSGAISKSYDAVLIGMLGYASRTSYVIAPTGQIVYAYSAMDPTGHVGNTLKAVTEYEAAHPMR